MAEYKTCPDCKQTLPATTEFFAPFKRNTTTGLYTYCRSCARIRDKRYKDNNREELRRRDNERSKVNREKKHFFFKRWYDKNRKSKRIPQTAEERRDLKHQYNRTHRDLINKQRRQYHVKKPHKNRQWVNNRRARKLALPVQFTDADWSKALDYWHGTCAYCGNQQDFWHSLEADHFIPLTDAKCPGTVSGNMLPACKSCNASKHNYDPASWLTDRFGARKAAAILSRIADYFASLTPVT